MFILNAAYAQSPTMLSKSKSEEKVLDDINSESWILPQYFNKEKKEEIIKYVLPENAMFGNILENPDAPPLIEIIKANNAPTKTDGITSGKVMVRNACKDVAPIPRAASSKDLSRPSKLTFRTIITNGNAQRE